MPDYEDNPIEGKGEEMVPAKGNPFDEIEESYEPDSMMTELENAALEDWQEERALDQAQSMHTADTLTREELIAIEMSETSEADFAGEISQEAQLETAMYTDEEARAAAEALRVDQYAEETAGGTYSEPIFSSASFEAPDFRSASPGSRFELPESMQPVDEDLQDALVTDKRIRDLWVRAEDAQTNVSDLIDNIRIARELLDMILAAKNMIISGRDNYEEAERIINEVEYRITLSYRVAGWSKREARRVLFYEIVWFILLAAGLFVLLSMNIPENITSLVLSGIIGGIGGVFGAMYSLWRHVAEEQDYSPQYNMWYYTQPIMGLPIGGFIYLVLNTGIQFSIGDTNAVSNPAIMYTLAGVAGFQQNVVYDIVRRVLKLFRIGQSE